MSAGLALVECRCGSHYRPGHVLVVGLEEVKCIAAIYNHTANSPYTCQTLQETTQSNIYSFGPTPPPKRQHGPLRVANNLPLGQRGLRCQLRCEPQQLTRLRGADITFVIASHTLQPAYILEHTTRSRDQLGVTVCQRLDVGIRRAVCA
jgi:hypothetical protein